MNNDKWYPKVGEEFEWRYGERDAWLKQKCIAVTAQDIGYESCEGFLAGASKDCDFRPIPNKQDVEREQLVEILDNSNWGKIRSLAENIQAAGFTIPQKVKRSDIVKIVYTHSEQDETCDQWIIDDICKLLGDLVEGDE